METLPLKIEMAERRRSTLADIFREKRDQLTGFIRKRVSDIAVAEDITQDVFTKLVNMYETVESVDAWMYAVARNRITDHYRKKKPESLEIEGEDGEENNLVNFLPDLSGSPERQIFQEAIWEELNNALGELPDEQREAFVMHEMEDYSIKEIAELQGVSVNTVLSRKRYAVMYLRDSLRVLYDELNL